MAGKLVYWSREEVRTVILFLSTVGFSHEEIFRRIGEVCGPDAVSRKEVDHILEAKKYAKAPAATRPNPFERNLCDVPPAEDDLEISDLFEGHTESILNYPMQSSKYQWNRWNSINKELYNRELFYSKSQFHPLHVDKTTEQPNCNGVKDQALHEKLDNIFESFSPQNFSVSVPEIKQLNIATEGQLNEVIDAVFEKAVDRPDFSIPYANMCKLLTLLKVPCSGQKMHVVDIGELLLTKCQKAFEGSEMNQLCKEKVEQGQLQKMSEEALKSRRQRQLAIARFMGWLFKLGIFMEFVMHRFIQNLLLQDGEVAAECVCILITDVGKELCSDKIESYISDLKRKIGKQCVSAKLGSLLQVICDLKVNNWVSYNEESGSKIIDDMLFEDHGEMLNCRKKSLPVDFDDSMSGYDEQEKNHWSPVNHEGSVQYDRQSLLNLRFLPLCMQKPPNLPDLDVIKDKPQNIWMSCREKENVKKCDAFLKEIQGEVNKKQEIPLRVTLVDSIPSDMDRCESHLTPQGPVPLNQYDRKFLLNLQYHPKSTKKPAGLPDLNNIKSKWIPQRDENNLQQKKLQQVTFPKRVPHKHDRQRNWPPTSEDLWYMSGKTCKRNYSVDLMKLNLAKRYEIQSVQLGLGGKFSSWGESDSAENKSSSIEQHSSPAALQNNRCTSTDI